MSEEEKFARQPFELRGYQREAVVGVRKSWSQFGRSLGVAPTGSGKTLVFADIAEKRLARGGRVLILAHRDELINQKQWPNSTELAGAVHAGRAAKTSFRNLIAVSDECTPPEHRA